PAILFSADSPALTIALPAAVRSLPQPACLFVRSMIVSGIPGFRRSGSTVARPNRATETGDSQH
ncbi:MAG: hypothetical protein OXC91_11850, partial [Rhodobacteraceae bacterium]|nr:hypothetical protein [Paracoccaceae bacterium]